MAHFPLIIFSDSVPMYVPEELDNVIGYEFMLLFPLFTFHKHKHPSIIKLQSQYLARIQHWRLDEYTQDNGFVSIPECSISLSHQQCSLHLRSLFFQLRCQQTSRNPDFYPFLAILQLIKKVVQFLIDSQLHG